MQYTDCAVGASCTKTFTLTETLTAPVYFYYGFKGFYQNHRRYLKYYSSSQLSSGTVAVSTVSSLLSRLVQIVEIMLRMLRLLGLRQLLQVGERWWMGIQLFLVELLRGFTICFGLKSEDSAFQGHRELSP